jgi:hypothetical protein
VSRFVILEHDHPQLHWDLMLEAGEKLRTWRLATPPDAAAASVDAVALADHRRMYLDYEGPVSGGRGSVTQWDSGTFELLASAPGLETLRFRGVRLHGVWTLKMMADARWRLTPRHPAAQ